ncbi:immunoglobulin-like domain-containing protein, partial [Escherichia coli]
TVTDTPGTDNTTTVTLTAPSEVSEGGQITYTATLSNKADTDVTLTLDNKQTITIKAGETVGTVTWNAGPNSASSDVQIVGTLEPPTLWWRLTHPGQLGGPFSPP